VSTSRFRLSFPSLTFLSALWAGNNTGGQHVFTWIAANTTQRFVGDINQLITDLYSLSGYLYPSSSDYLGVFSFGTEAFYSDSNVTFWVPEFSLDMTTS
jgi:Glycosyl hydrolase family 12.